MVEFYVDDVEISIFRSLSVDWVGGGLFIIMDDFLQFMEVLNIGKFINCSIYEVM